MREDDIPAVYEIEEISFTTPLTKQDFLNKMYEKNALSKVAVFKGNIIGYICIHYRLHKSHILNLAVHPDFRRQGVAARLMDEAIRELKKKAAFLCILKSGFQIPVPRDFMSFLGLKLKASGKNTMAIRMKMRCS
jgi:ribosomal-protein-alanine N-acetyltransferase